MTNTFGDHKDGEDPWDGHQVVQPSPHVVGNLEPRITGVDPLLGPVLLHLLLLLFIHISPRHVWALGEREAVILASGVIRGVVLMFVIP